MKEMDLATRVNQDDSETQARLPWESIDPPEKKARPSVSTAREAVEAVEQSPANKHQSLAEYDESDAGDSLEQDELYATHAFFPDELDESAVTVAGPGASPLADENVVDEIVECEIDRESAFHANDASAVKDGIGVVLASQPVEHSKAEPDEQTHIPAAAEQIRDINSVLTSASDNLDTADDDVVSPIHAPIDATPWAMIEASEVELSNATIQAEAPASPIIEHHAEPAAEAISDNVTEPSVFDTGRTAAAAPTPDSLVAAAVELSAMADSFAAVEVDEQDTSNLGVTVNNADTSGVFVVPTPQPSIETEPVVDELDETEIETSSPTVTAGGGWTIPLMCLGIGLIACCMVIPQGESNRKLRYEQATLAMDLDHVQKQVAVNDEFLKKVMDDPTLAERLAGRQMKTIRRGQTVVSLKDGSSDKDMSPFSLVAVAPPAPLPPYQPARGTIADLCNDSRSRLYLLGLSMAMVAVGLVMGFNPKRV